MPKHKQIGQSQKQLNKRIWKHRAEAVIEETKYQLITREKPRGFLKEYLQLEQKP